MKSSPTLLQDASDDDIFGPPRTYTASYYTTTRQRPSMISAKYRQKEERRKVLKISVNKLRKIEDPENSLCRSVLINNTMKRLQRESKEEKLNQCHHHHNQQQQQQQQQQLPQIKKTEFAKLEPDTDLIIVDHHQKFPNFTEELVVVTTTHHQEIKSDIMPSPRINKRSIIDEVEDCDVQDVLSQFYMPPTPRMLTTIDDDDDEDIIPAATTPTAPIPTITTPTTIIDTREKRLMSCDDYIPEMKRTKYEDELPAKQMTTTSTTTTTTTTTHHQVTVPVTTASSFSCGHSSIFNDLQNNVFHSLVASLET